jgi:signal transduction histidine kinase
MKRLIKINQQSQATPFIYLIPGVLLLLPAIYVILLLDSTIKSETAAMKNNIRENYQHQLVDASNKLSGFWQKVETDGRLDVLDPVEILYASGADSVVLYDQNGKMIFPILPAINEFYKPIMAKKFDSAAKLTQKANYLLAINEYIYISENGPNNRERAMALYEAAVLLHKIKKPKSALDKCHRIMFMDKYKNQRDKTGELISLNTKLLFLNLEPQGTEKYKEILNELVSLLVSYDNTEILTTQRYFLSKKLKEIHPEIYFPLEESEKIALELFQKIKNPDRRNILQKTLVEDLWQYTVSGRVVLLYTEKNLDQIMISLIGVANIPDKTEIELKSPDSVNEDAIATLSVVNRMPGWKISLNFDDPNYMTSLINQRIKVYRTTTLLVIAFSLTLGFLFVRDMRRRLRLADLKNDLVANVTHELKTPLASTRLLLDTLMCRMNIPPEKLKSYLQHLSTENSRLCRLVEHFLAFSKLEKNQYNFQIVQICLDDLLDALNEAIRGRFPNQKHRIKTDCVDEEVYFNADIQSLVTVLLNLLENALKFSDESKHVYLEIAIKGKMLSFSVRDEGVGIISKNQKRVFNRFYQADERLSRNHGGCGLGLNIVKSVLSAHKSNIQIESIPDQGSNFSFDLLITTKGTT